MLPWEKACKWWSTLLSRAPGRARSLTGSQKCKRDGYTLGRFVNQHQPQNEPKEVFPCFKLTFMAWKFFFFLNLHFKKVYKLFWHQKKEKREEEVDANGQVPVRRKGIFQAWAHSQKVREFLSDSSRKKDHSTLNAKVIVEKSDSRHLISMSCHNWLWSRKYLVFWKYCLTKNWFLRWHGEESIY